MTKKLVGLDPGKANIAYMTDEEGNVLRFTSKQRKKEAYIDKSRVIRTRMRTENGIVEAEKPLSELNSKTVNKENFKEYIRMKVIVGEKVRAHYEQEVYRKMSLRSFIYSKKSLARFFKKIRNTYGKEVVIGYGNWSNNQIRGCDSSMNLGFRKELQKYFKVLLIDEYKTSKMCSDCHKEMKNVKVNGKKAHRSLRCEGCHSHNDKDGVTHYKMKNRDLNGATNILKVMKSELLGEGRPDYLRRKEEASEGV